MDAMLIFGFTLKLCAVICVLYFIAWVLEKYSL